MGPGSFPGVKSGRGVTLTPHPLLVPWSWKSRAIPLLPVWAVRPVQSLSACARVHFTFTFQAGYLRSHLFLLIPSQISAAISQQEKVLHTLGAVVRIGAVYWGTALQAGRSRVPFHMGPTTWSFRLHNGCGVDLASNGNECQGYLLGIKAVGT